MFKIIFLILGIFILWEIIFRTARKTFPSPAPSFLGYFLDSKFRKLIQPPDKVIERTGIKEGMRVLEIGCGSGTFTVLAARKLGRSGEIYALDVQDRMLKQLKKKLERAENRDVKNIKIVKSDACFLPFDDNFFDLIFMVAVLPEISDKNKALWEAKRVLKRGGILALTEFLPDPDYPLKSTTIRLGGRMGLILEKSFGRFWNYTVRFIKP